MTSPPRWSVTCPPPNTAPTLSREFERRREPGHAAADEWPKAPCSGAAASAVAAPFLTITGVQQSWAKISSLPCSTCACTVTGRAKRAA